MKKVLKIIIITILIIIIESILFYYYTYDKHIKNDFPIILSSNTTLKDDNIIVEYKLNEYNLNHNDIYCNYKINNDNEYKSKWTKTSNNKCNIKIDIKGKYYIYLKNENNDIYEVPNTENYGLVTNIKTNKDNIYLAINGNDKLEIEIDSIGNIDVEPKITIEDEKIVSIDSNRNIKGISKGNTTINIESGNINKKVNIVVTDLIVKKLNKYNNKKKYLPCNRYSEEENDLLDLILKSRIDDVGYKTRAGAVEAARFLTLEFPYKIRYFSENGRLSTNKVEGEGRYYNVGLYLHKSRYKNIKKSLAGPATWGCSIYSRPSKGKRSNGLDCSGFISWVLLNGGFDVGDVGAGLAPHLDLTDYGERIKFNKKVIESGKVKVGDLLSSGGVNGGHIAMIAGEDDNYYYVAESLWTTPNVAVLIMPYSKKTIYKRYYYVMLMDSYYKEDGNLTKMWY